MQLRRRAYLGLLSVVVMWLGTIGVARADLALSWIRPLEVGYSFQGNPAISGSKAVYEDDSNGSSDIYYYDLAAGTRTRISKE